MDNLLLYHQRTGYRLAAVDAQVLRVVLPLEDGGAGPWSNESGVELFYVLDHSARLQIGQSQLLLRKNFFLLLKKGAGPTDRFTCGGNGTRLFIPLSLLDRHAGNTLSFPFSRRESWGFIEPLFDTLHPTDTALEQLLEGYRCAESERNGIRQHYFLEHISGWLFSYQQKLAEKIVQGPFAKLSTKIEVCRRLQCAHDYILTQFCSIHSLKQIAQVCHLAPGYLLKHYRTFYGTTPHQQIVQLRLEEAKHLLSHTELPVWTIIDIVGFKNVSSFIRLFRLTNGVTPAVYRKNNKGMDKRGS